MRKPEEFDQIGDSRIWSATDPDTGDGVLLRFIEGRLQLEFAVGGDGAVHSSQALVSDDSAAELATTLSAYLLWRKGLPLADRQHRFCPVHGLSMNPPAPDGVLACAKGCRWKAIRGQLVPLEDCL